MPTDIIRLGPFVGGLNTASDPSAIADAELVECINFELDTDNSLVSRPAMQVENGLLATWTERIVLLGVGVFPSGNFVIGSNTNGVFRYQSGAWTLITATFQASCMVQYQDSVWLIAKPGSVNPGGQWDPVGGFTAQANLPKGSAAVVFKERLFVVPGNTATADTSRLVFSQPGNFLDYDPVIAANQAAPGTNFILIANGDGQKLVDIEIYRGNVLLFKEDSTYVLAFESNPSDAVVESISVTVGATKTRCVVQHENTVFVYHEGDVFELVNYDFNKINVKCKFEYDGSVPPGETRVEDVFLSIIGDRVFVRYFNRMYVYGVRTRIWTRWVAISLHANNVGPWVALPSDATQNVNTVYYAGSSILQRETLTILKDGYDTTFNEVGVGPVNLDIECSIKTKNYDIAASHLYKRLQWWGVDLLTGRNVRGTVQPVVSTFKVTWGSLNNQNITWSQMKTWGAPTTTIPAITQLLSVQAGAQRYFLRFIKGLRYRQISFKLEMVSNGTTVDGPARIYTISIATKVKQTVPKAVN